MVSSTVKRKKNLNLLLEDIICCPFNFTYFYVVFNYLSKDDLPIFGIYNHFYNLSIVIMISIMNLYF